MPDIANLTIRVDSEGVATASRRLEDFQGSGQQAERSTQSLTRSIGAKVAAIGAATLSVRSLIQQTRASIAAYEEREQAEVSLRAAIQATGAEAEMSVASVVQYANAIQDTTTFSSEAATQAAATLQSFSDLRQDGIEEALPAVADLATAMGMDLDRAAQLVARSVSGTTNALGRYGIEIDTSASESERLEQVLGEIEGKFGGVSEEMANAATGAIPQFTNALDDSRALMGQMIIETIEPFVRGLTDIIARSNEMTEARRNIAAVVEGEAESADQVRLAIEQQNMLIAEQEARIDALGDPTGQLAERYRSQLRDLEGHTLELQKQLAIMESREEEQRREAEHEASMAEWQEEQTRAEEEAAERSREINETAAEERQRIQEEYERWLMQSETDTIRRIEMEREQHLDRAAEQYVRSGEEIAMINEMYNDRIAEAERELAEAREEEQQRYLDSLRSDVMPLIQEARTDQDRYREGIDALTEAYREGAITMEEYGQGVDALKDRYHEIEEETDRFVEQMDRINQRMTERAVDAFADGLHDIGFALGEGSVGAENFGQAVAGVGRSILNMIPQMSVAAGLRILLENPYDPRGWMLLGGGAVGMAGSGFIEGQINDQAALGGVYHQGARIEAYAKGGVVNEPTLFPMAKGAGLMGEAGPEAIMPLTRNSDGELGVRSDRTGGDANVTVNVINNAEGTETRTEEHQNSESGEKEIRVFIENVVNEGLAKGRFDRPNGARYGLRPKGVKAG